jgi:hypothetical protein
MHVIDYFNHSLYSQEKHILVAIHLAEASPSLRKEWPNQQQKTARISTQLEKMQEQKKVVEYPNSQCVSETTSTIIKRPQCPPNRLQQNKI